MRSPSHLPRAFVLAFVGAHLAGAPGCFMDIDEALLRRQTSGEGGVPETGSIDASGADAGTTYRSAVLADRPIGYWRLGEKAAENEAGADGAGATVRDEVGSFPGVYSPKVALGVPGAIAGDPDTAAHFEIANGSTLAIRAAPLRFLGRASFSVEAWVRPNITEAQCVVSAIGRWSDQGGGFGQDGWRLDLDDRRRASFARYHGREDDAAAVNWVVGDPPIALNAYAHVVGVHDGQAGEIWIYVDGTRFGPTRSTFVTEYQLQDLGIGTYTFPSLDWACSRSDIDDVAIYDRPLTADEVLRHYRAGTSRSTQ